MFFKRQFPVYIMVTVGLLTLLGHFIKGGGIEDFIQKDSLSWFNIIASFSILLGAFNLLKIHFQKFFKKQKDWQYSLIALIGFVSMIVGGFFFKGANYLKIEVNEKNIQILAPEKDGSFVLNNKMIDAIEKGFEDKLISKCDNPIYINKLSCHDNEGVWESRVVDPSEFSNLIYDKTDEIIGESISSELTWMIYDYLTQASKNKKYNEIVSSEIPIYKLKNILDKDLSGVKEKSPITNDCFVLNHEDGTSFFKREGYCDVGPKKELSIILKGFPDWRFFENFKDSNNNNRIDIAEEYSDSNNNGRYDEDENFLDVGNGILDEGELFYDCGIDFNETYVCSSPDFLYDYGSDNNINFFDEDGTQGNGKWDEGEEFIDLNRDGKWNDSGSESWVYWLLPYANGSWDSAEDFRDLGNGKYDKNEEYIDSNRNGIWEEEELFIDLGNGVWNLGEEFKDSNKNGRWDAQEFFFDKGDGIWNDSERVGFSVYNFLFKRHWKKIGFKEYFKDYYDKIDEEGIFISKKFVEKRFSKNSLIEEIIPINKEISNFISVESVDWGDHVTESGTFFKWLFDSAYSPIDMTMFALLAFFVASASYRAFRIRNFEASLLLLAGVLVMLGAVPIGKLISSWMFAYLFLFILFAFLAPLIKNKKFLYIGLGISSAILFIIVLIFDISGLTAESIKTWIITYPTVAGKKAIMMGIALGIVATSLRIIFGKDKSFLGD